MDGVWQEYVDDDTTGNIHFQSDWLGPWLDTGGGKAIPEYPAPLTLAHTNGSSIQNMVSTKMWISFKKTLGVISENLL